MPCPCETRTSTWRSFATISSGLYRFLAIAVLLDVKDIPQVGPLQWGRIIGRQLIPSNIDQLTMIRGINLCVQWYSDAREFSTNKGLEDRIRRRERMYKKAKALHH